MRGGFDEDVEMEDEENGEGGDREDWSLRENAVVVEDAAIGLNGARWGDFVEK